VILPSGKQPAFASISTATLERTVVDELTRLRGNERLIEETVAADEARRAGGHSALHHTYFQKQAQINEAQAALERFLEAFASGVLPLSPATTRKHKQLEDRVARLEEEASAVRAQLEQVEPSPDRISRLKAALAALPDTLRNGTLEQRYAVLRTIVHRVWVNNHNEITLDLAFG
jgi:DNA repair exonuclease SbcCD ATPase subunit